MVPRAFPPSAPASQGMKVVPEGRYREVIRFDFTGTHAVENSGDENENGDEEDELKPAEDQHAHIENVAVHVREVRLLNLEKKV